MMFGKPKQEFSRGDRSQLVGLRRINDERRKNKDVEKLSVWWSCVPKDHLFCNHFCNHFSIKVVLEKGFWKSGFSGQPLFLNLKKCGFMV